MSVVSPGVKSGLIVGVQLFTAQSVVAGINNMKRRDLKTIDSKRIDLIIRLAWSDRATFESIEEQTGLSESDVIQVMRRELKPSSFKLWRARVSGRITKHRKRLKSYIQ